MKSITQLFLIILVFNACSCTKDPVATKNEDFLIFGTFFGHCVGDQCKMTFKLEGDKLYQDISHTYPNRTTFFEGNFKELDNNDFNASKDLRDHFPKALLQEKDTVFGCPDCADQGGIYIEYKSGNTHRFWVLDNAMGNVPAYLHPFMEEIRQKVEKLKKQ